MYLLESCELCRFICCLQTSTLREVRNQRFKERRVADFDNIPADVMAQLTKTRGSDLGLGSKGRRLVARYKRSIKSEGPAKVVKEKVLSRKKRTAFNPINFDR